MDRPDSRPCCITGRTSDGGRWIGDDDDVIAAAAAVDVAAAAVGDAAADCDRPPGVGRCG